MHTESAVSRSSCQGPPSTRQRTGWSDQLISARALASMKATLPEGNRIPWFTMRDTTPEIAHPGHVGEVADLPLAAGAGELDPAQVQHGHVAAGQRLHGAVHVGGDPDGPPQVPSGPARDEAEEHPVPGGRRALHPVDDLAGGPVPAHRHQELAPRRHGLARQPHPVPALPGEGALEVPHRRAHRPGDGVEVAPGPAGGAGWVHDEERLHRDGA